MRTWPCHTAPISGSVLPLCWLAGSMLLVTLLVAHLPQERIGCDFFSFWTAGELLASAQSPYDADHQARVQRRLGWDREVHGRGLYDFMPYYYPPWLGLAFTALVPLGYPAAKVAWISLDFELLLITGHLRGTPWRESPGPHGGRPRFRLLHLLRADGPDAGPWSCS